MYRKFTWEIMSNRTLAIHINYKTIDNVFDLKKTTIKFKINHYQVIHIIFITQFAFFEILSECIIYDALENVSDN